MANLPTCFGRWITQSANKCEKCGVQMECYGKMRQNEKEREKVNARKETPWYKRNIDVVEFPGFCEKCG